jgi:hypothetical protein
MPNKTRIEREIDEILEKSDGDAKPRSKRKRQFEPFTPKAPKRKSPAGPDSIKFNPGSVIIVGLVILAIAAFSPAARLPLAIAGILTVVAGYVLWFRKGGAISGRVSRRGGGSRPTEGPGDSEPQVKYWRGRRIDEKPERPEPGNRDDRGKIIEFRPPVDDLDPDDRGKDDR